MTVRILTKLCCVLCVALIPCSLWAGALDRGAMQPRNNAAAENMIRVPGVVGMGDQQALALLQQAGLQVTVKYLTREQSKLAGSEFTVIKQTPGAGGIAMLGSAIRLTVYKPPGAERPAPYSQQGGGYYDGSGGNYNDGSGSGGYNDTPGSYGDGGYAPAPPSDDGGGYGDSGYGAPSSGDPGYGDSGSGDSGYGDPGTDPSRDSGGAPAPDWGAPATPPSGTSTLPAPPSAPGRGSFNVDPGNGRPRGVPSVPKFGSRKQADPVRRGKFVPGSTQSDTNNRQAEKLPHRGPSFDLKDPTRGLEKNGPGRDAVGNALHIPPTSVPVAQRGNAMQLPDRTNSKDAGLPSGTQRQKALDKKSGVAAGGRQILNVPLLNQPGSATGWHSSAQ